MKILTEYLISCVWLQESQNTEAAEDILFYKEDNVVVYKNKDNDGFFAATDFNKVKTRYGIIITLFCLCGLIV